MTMSNEKIKNFVYYVILAAVPLIAFIPYIPLGGLGLSADDVLFLFVIAVGLAAIFILAAKGEKFNLKGIINNVNVFWPFMALIIVSIFSCLYNIANIESSSEFISMLSKGPFRFLLTLLFMIIIYCFLNSKRKIINVLWSLILTSAIESMFGITAFLLSWQGPFNIGISASRDYSALYGIVSGRINGTFGSVLENFVGSNLLASYLVILIPISAVFIILYKKRWQKAFLGGILMLQLICLSLTYTRTSIVFVILSLMFFAWILGRKKIIYAILGLLIVFALLVPGLKERFIMDSTNRTDIWKSAVLVIEDYPLWGVGPGKYLKTLSGDVIKYEVFTFDTEVLTPHNFFLYAWATIGVFGFLSLCWIVYAVGKDLWNRFKRAENPRVKILLAGILASAIGFLMQNFTNNFLFVPTVAVYFWVLYAMGLRIGEKT